MTSQLSVLEGHHKVTASTLKTLSTVLKKQQQDYTELRSQHKALQQQLQETRAEADAASKHASAAARDKAAPTKLDVSCEPRSAQAVSDKAEPRYNTSPATPCAVTASAAGMPHLCSLPWLSLP
jgi:septal ring factor EnvC (AmiA/AmiB activator)